MEASTEPRSRLSNTRTEESTTGRDCKGTTTLAYLDGYAPGLPTDLQELQARKRLFQPNNDNRKQTRVEVTMYTDEPEEQNNGGVVVLSISDESVSIRFPRDGTELNMIEGTAEAHFDWSEFVEFLEMLSIGMNGIPDKRMRDTALKAMRGGKIDYWETDRGRCIDGSGSEDRGENKRNTPRF